MPLKEVSTDLIRRKIMFASLSMENAPEVHLTPRAGPDPQDFEAGSVMISLSSSAILPESWAA